MAIDMISYLMGQQAGGGGGSGDKDSNYKSITENQDGTYTVIDSDDVSHIISITETDGTISAILDGNAIPISLDADGNIIKIGNSDISIPEQGECGYSGVSVIPIQNMTEAMQTNILGGLSQSIEPTTTGENPQTYQDEQGVWHNKYWLDTSVSPNVWKEYNPDNQSWETV